MLRSLIQKPTLSFLMEAHNGLSARIAAEAGFEGLWGSGLAISASHGVRDANELSVSEVVHAVSSMQEAVSVPILLDGDTGFGNFNNARRLVRHLERAGVGGVCFEDKLFPKTNSFVNGDAQSLADKREFGLKIRACKDAQRHDDFVVVARLESFITGNGLEDAVERASVYRDSGADAILCHSKLEDASDIEAFMNRWHEFRKDCPVLIVPTTYPQVPTQDFHDLGVSTVIWANHNVRAATAAMQRTSDTIFREQSIRSIEPTVCTVKELFRIQGQDQLTADEGRYLAAETSPSTRTYGSEHYLVDEHGKRPQYLTDDMSPP